MPDPDAVVINAVEQWEDTAHVEYRIVFNSNNRLRGIVEKLPRFTTAPVSGVGVQVAFRNPGGMVVKPPGGGGFVPLLDIPRRHYDKIEPALDALRAQIALTIGAL